MELITENNQPQLVFNRIRKLAELAWTESGNAYPFKPDLDTLYLAYELNYLHVHTLINDSQVIGYAVLIVQRHLFSTYVIGDVWSMYIRKEYRNLATIKLFMQNLKAACSHYCDEMVIHKPYRRHHGAMCDLTYYIRVR